MHAEIFVSQQSGTPIRVGCLCGLPGDHEPLPGTARRLVDRPVETTLSRDTTHPDTRRRAES